jgi:hypothetical protein
LVMKITIHSRCRHQAQRISTESRGVSISPLLVAT